MIIKVIRAVYIAVAVHVVMVVGGVSVVVMVFAGVVIGVAAVAIGFPRVRRYGEYKGQRECEKYRLQNALSLHFNSPRFLFVEPDGVTIVEMVFADVVEFVFQGGVLQLLRQVGIDIDIEGAVIVWKDSRTDGIGERQKADKDVIAHSLASLKVL